jgi:predicted sulfurtransferase
MKHGVLRTGLCGLLAANLLLSVAPLPGVGGLFSTGTEARAEAPVEAKKVKGKITNISQKAKTIALSGKDQGFFLVKFDDKTVLKGVESSKDFKVSEAVIISYKKEGEENLALSIEKALVKLPQGTAEIKTDALAKMVKESDNLVVIDARPPARYAESHIPGSVSIPYAKLKKMGEDGGKLYEKYKGKQLVIYCGGPT